ncbi:MAG TPA: hypothetical protein VN706_22475 [Gemmatimonadaceae bacterium]|nr:hypothetical protein [Gemmatimonadaceae bacterium]
MGISRYDILERDKIPSGLLKGKVISNVFIPVIPARKFVAATAFPTSDLAYFKKWCDTERPVEFPKRRKLPAWVYTYVAGLLADKRYQAAAMDLWYMSDDKIYLAIDSPVHWKASRFGPGERGQNAQASFDNINMYGKTSVSGAYRERHYVLTVTLFGSVEAAQAFCNTYYGGNAGMKQIRGKDAAAIKPQTNAYTTQTQMRNPEKWFSAVVNHIVPQEFVDALDENAKNLVFPRGTFAKLFDRPNKAYKVQLTDEQREIIFRELVNYDPSASDDVLLAEHNRISDHTAIDADAHWVMPVKSKCDLGIQIRVPKPTMPAIHTPPPSNRNGNDSITLPSLT